MCEFLLDSFGRLVVNLQNTEESYKSRTSGSYDANASLRLELTLKIRPYKHLF